MTVLQGTQELVKPGKFSGSTLGETQGSLLGQRVGQIYLSRLAEDHIDFSSFIKENNLWASGAKSLGHPSEREPSLLALGAGGQPHLGPTRHSVLAFNKTRRKSGGAGILALLQAGQRHAQEGDEDELTRRELALVREHRGQNAGRWGALQGNVLLATGDFARDVYAQIADRDDTPLVVQVEEATEHP